MRQVSDDNYLPTKNVEYFYFTTDMAKSIVLFEKTVEVIGIVSQIELKSNLLKFSISNKTNDAIQILIWDQQIISSYKSIIMNGNVLHIDQAFARSKYTKQSCGTIAYDLTIMSNTKITLLKKLPMFEAAIVHDIQTISKICI